MNLTEKVKRGSASLRSLIHGNPADPIAQRQEALEALGTLQSVEYLTASDLLVEAHRKYLRERDRTDSSVDPSPSYRHFHDDVQVWPPLPEGVHGWSPPDE